MAVDPRNFLFNTDYEMDKIIYFTSGSITANEYQKTITHNLGFKPLIFGVCATASDFSDPRTIPYENITQDNSIWFYAKASASNRYLEFVNFSDQNAKMYYRIYAFEPSDSNADIVPTGDNASQFILNTDYNYCKLHSKGELNEGGTVTHNLGYIPQVLAWYETKLSPNDDTKVVTPIDMSQPINPLDTPMDTEINTSSVVFQGYPSKIYYRIYYDEN